MERREFVKLLAATPLASRIHTEETEEIPKYKIVSPYKPEASSGMPGPYPGKVVSVKSARCLNETGEEINADAVREMMERGMRELTGEAKTIDAWRRFINPDDIVGIKVNVNGYPWVYSSHPVVAEVVSNLLAIGLKPSQVYVYDRFQDQLDRVNYPPQLPEGVNYFGAESGNRR